MSSPYRCPECGDEFLFRPDPCPTCASRQRQKQRAARAKEKRGSYDLTGQVAAAEFWQLLRWYPCCPCCGRPWSQVGSAPVQDHIIPLSRGGPNTAANLQPLCPACNGWKADFLIYFDRAVPGQVRPLPQHLWPSFRRWLRLTGANRGVEDVHSILSSPCERQLDWLDPSLDLGGGDRPHVVQQLAYPLASPAQLQAETLRLTLVAISLAEESLATPTSGAKGSEAQWGYSQQQRDGS
ncbi:HNH endonuclease [Synechococcus sp. H55.7]|uniref:HNH endonuclease n=1 Tax=unclassified Synechococcus TaxID=2626047 RepID=UPI0039C458FF